MDKTLKRNLELYLQKHDNILLAYLFGSRASGKIGAISDYDIGIYLKQKIEFKEKYFMEVEIRNLLNINSLDLVIMNEAPLALNYNIICGKCLYAVNQNIRVEFEANLLSRFFDYLPILRKHNLDILSSIKDEQQIQRNRSALAETEKLLAEIRAA